MITDRYGSSHSVTTPAAVQAFEEATLAVAAHQPIGDSIDRALALEPDMASAWALLSIGNALLGRSEAVAVAKARAKGAQVALARSGEGTRSERAIVQAASQAADGHLQASAKTLEDHLRNDPADFLAAKIAHSMRFMCGQPEHMLAISGLALTNWRESDPGYGFLLGCHAFGLEEIGRYRDAEAAGRRAVALEPTDAWGLHAVSHVMEMSGRTAEGIVWLEGSRPLWPGCNNFRFHLAWHLGLFQLEAGDADAVLKLYDTDVMPAASDDFRDIANAVSLLWRLKQSGIDVGARWGQLRDLALKRHQDLTYVFASLHYLLALVATGEREAAARLINGLAARAGEQGCDQGQVARELGLELAKVIATSGTVDTSGLARIAPLLSRLGGSNAQRDLFMRILLVAAAEGGNELALSHIARLRANLRQEDRFARNIAAARTIGQARGAA